MFLPNWRYDGGDPGLKLFTLANEKLPSVPAGGSVLEVGHVDTDWSARVKACDPSLRVVAIDWRNGKPLQDVEAIQGDVLTHDFPAESFDAVVGLSSFEHVGLGHYRTDQAFGNQADPLDEFGDVHLMTRIRRWLKPGGWCYCDVPYDPINYSVKGTKCRIYDDQALAERFGPHEVLGYATPNVDGWIKKPTTANTTRGYDYVALLIRN